MEVRDGEGVKVCIINEYNKKEFYKSFRKTVEICGGWNEVDVQFCCYVDGWGDVHYVGYVVYKEGSEGG